MASLSSRSVVGSLLGLLCLCSLSVSGCVVVTGDDGFFDYPIVQEVDAVCDDLGFFELWADVSHEDGPRSVVSVWVEVSYVLYDDFDDSFLDYLGSIDLDYIADGQWGIVLAPGDPLLDCYYPGEYHYGFYAEDGEGDVSSVELVN